jgi:RNA polymerase sigma factor (sigma-70 family)
LNFATFDREYIRRLTQGDAATEEHFANYFGDLLYLKLRARLRCAELIEDIRQETLLRVLQILRRKDGVEYPERFGAFVNAVCNNVKLEFCRKPHEGALAEERHEDPPDPTINLDAPLIQEDLKRLIQHILAELPERDRRILESVYLKEMDKTEVCLQFDIDSEYLRVLLHRAKLRCRKAKAKANAKAKSAGV